MPELNKRNTLKQTLAPFNEQSEIEKMETQIEQNTFFDSIDSYCDCNKPSLEDLKTVERVLKYASDCKWMGFTKEDALLVFGVSTNVLKWGLGYNKKDE